MTLAQLDALIRAENARNAPAQGGPPQPEPGTAADLLALAAIGNGR